MSLPKCTLTNFFKRIVLRENNVKTIDQLYFYLIVIRLGITFWEFNSGGTRKPNNEWKGVVEFGPQTWSIDLVLVIIERGNLILGVPPPRGAAPHPPKITFTSKMEINEAVNEFFSTSNIFAPVMSTLNGQKETDGLL